MDEKDKDEVISARDFAETVSFLVRNGVDSDVVTYILGSNPSGQTNKVIEEKISAWMRETWQPH